MKKALCYLVIATNIVLCFSIGCKKDESTPSYPETTRLDRIPANAIKMTPVTDESPPILHSADFEIPVPLGPEVNTAGAEDSPFIPVGRNDLYFFFTPDVNIAVEQQIFDEVSGIWMSKQNGNAFNEPERIWLQDPGKLSLDGAEFIEGNNMLFVSAREGYTGLHWFSADYENGQWDNWQNADFDPNYEVGELHIYGGDLYYHSARNGGLGSLDIWMLSKIDGQWQNPVNITAVNTVEDEGWPYISSDGMELWITRTYLGTPSLFRSKKQEGSWQEPELIVSQFAGEATLDHEGNLYFVHHFFKDGKMIEADIYRAKKKNGN